MKLGIIGLPSEKNFSMAAEKGLEFLEFCINVGTDPYEVFNDVNAIKEWSRKYNIGVASIGTSGTERIDAEGQILEDELKVSYKLIDVAAELGCPNYVCGCNYVKELSFYENCTAAIAFLTKLIEYARPKGVKIATYNCRWNNFIIDSKAWSIIHEHLKELGIKYDPTHSRYDGGDYLKEARDWGNRMTSVRRPSGAPLTTSATATPAEMMLS